MKTIIASLIAIATLTGTASAGTVFADIQNSAPRSTGVFGDLQNSAPRSPFDQLNTTAPKSIFDQVSVSNGVILNDIDLSASIRKPDEPDGIDGEMVGEYRGTRTG